MYKRQDVYGAGDSDDYGFNYAAALAEANKRGDAALYVVKTSTDANKMTDLADVYKRQVPAQAHSGWLLRQGVHG